MELLPKQPTTKGPAELFTGDVWLDVIARGEVLVIRPGDVIHTPPGEEHWHGAAPDAFMVHTALWEDDDATWGDHVTDEEYGVR